MLRMSQVRFVSASDPRLLSTIEAIAHRLGKGVLVYRYDVVETDDGLEGGEGAFLLCSFWLADALAHVGRLEDAQLWFERLLALASPLGLYAEEADTRTGELLGNFPQAFTHLAQIGAAVNIREPATAASGSTGCASRARGRPAPRAACARGRRRGAAIPLLHKYALTV